MIDFQGFRLAACRSAFILLVIVLLPGCSAKPKNLQESIKFFGMTYYNYQQIWKRPPANWEEILTMANVEGLEADLEMLNRVKDSDYTIIWNVDCNGPNPQDSVLAYEPVSIKRGGMILFADGSLRSLAANQLADNLAKAKDSDEHK